MSSFLGRKVVVGTTAGALAGLAVGLGVSLVGTPAAAASPLPAFGGCEELRQWYVDRALPRVGPYGLDGGVWPAAEGGVVSGSGAGSDSGSGSGSGDALAVAPAPAPVAGARDLEAQSSSGTGTNVQEAGVDEPDLAKTDGELLVRVTDGELRVSRVGGVTGTVDEIGRLELPADLRASELLLSGTRVLVVGSSYDGGVPGPVVSVLPAPGVGGGVGPEPRPLVPPDPLGEPEPLPLPDVAPPPGTLVFPAPSLPDTSRVLEVDLTDASAPRVLSDRTYGGSLVSARQYDGVGGSLVRLVLHTGTPTLDFVQPSRDRTPAEATEENRRIVRGSDLDDWLPQVRESSAGADSAQDLLACDQVRRPAEEGSRGDLGTLSIVTLPFSDPTSTSATAVTTSAQTAYSSADRLYLALPDGEATRVHAFALSGADTRYVASGTVRGTVRDRWSMDEHDGVLRMAVAFGGWQATENGIVTLRESGDRLEVLGSVRGLGPDEEIKSVRWFDDLAVVVTFRQTDPLYTVDLSVPSSPTTLGALKIPGFSTYLHPIGDGRLLGIGQDADLSGSTLGTQASVFDVSDLRDPRRVAQLPLDGTTLLAETDPRALTWVPEAGAALAGGFDEARGTSVVVQLRVGPDGSLARGRTWPLGSAYDGTGGSPRALPLGDGRVALVGAGVEVVTLT